MLGLMHTLLAKCRYGDDCAKAIIFIANDPHVAGGTHLPDINMAMPVFADGTAASASCATSRITPTSAASRARQHGGRHVGDLPGGPRIPVMRLYPPRRAAEPSMSRSAAAQHARCRRSGAATSFRPDRGLPAGRRSACGEMIAPAARRWSRAAFDQILDRTAKRMRAGIAAFPTASYRFEDVHGRRRADGTANVPVRARRCRRHGRPASCCRLHRHRPAGAGQRQPRPLSGARPPSAMR